MRSVNFYWKLISRQNWILLCCFFGTSKQWQSRRGWGSAPPKGLDIAWSKYRRSRGRCCIIKYPTRSIISNDRVNWVPTSTKEKSVLHPKTVVSSSRGQKQLKVVISNQPSCSCSDYTKFGKQAHWNHILFVFMHGHGVTDTSLFTNLQFTDEQLDNIFFVTPLNKQVIQPKEPAKRLSSAKEKRNAILTGHPNFNDL